MDHHSGRLVHHQEIGILVQNIQWNRLRPDLQRSGCRKLYANSVIEMDPIAGLAPLIIDSYVPVLNQLLETGARQG
jgi:hypothetical protein